MSCCSGCLFHELSGVRPSTSDHRPDIKGSSREPDRWATLFNIHDVCPSKDQDEQRGVCECVCRLCRWSSPCKMLGGGMRTRGIHLNIFHCSRLILRYALIWNFTLKSVFWFHIHRAHHMIHLWQYVWFMWEFKADLISAFLSKTLAIFALPLPPLWWKSFA